MQKIDGVSVLSATDLVGFLACAHLTGLEHARLAGLVEPPFQDDAELDIIRERGIEHEQRYLADLKAAGRSVTEISLDRDAPDRIAEYRRAVAATEDAMRAGADVVYQATFFDGRWVGFADFLLRVERPSGLGAWSYEVADTKLARHVKGSAVLQICSYIEQLTRFQGRQPDWLHVALGGKARETVRLWVPDYMAYYRGVKDRFERHLVTLGEPAFPPAGSYPEPAEHCAVCRWEPDCRKRRREDDHLSRVAGIGTGQRRALDARGVTTRGGFAAFDVPSEPRVEGVGPRTLERLWLQARLQVRDTSEEGGRLFELLEPGRLEDGGLDGERGLLILPEPRPGDLFFDIEGDPYAFEEGLEYLFGVYEPGRPGDVPPELGGGTFHAIWARDADGNVDESTEKVAFERLIDLLIERWAADPALHVFHYAAYEPTALKRLAGRHQTREREVDRILRAGLLVDLYRAVRQGIRASVESYSIKKLEPLYGYHREVELRTATSSVVGFENWLRGGQGRSDEGTLERIELYNRDDVVSTRLLRDWLELRRGELEVTLGGAALPRPEIGDGEPNEELDRELTTAEALAALLAPGGVDDGTEDGHARWLLAQLLSFHRREDRAVWGALYQLDTLSDEELVEDPSAIGGLRFEQELGKAKRSQVYRYRFDPQPHQVELGKFGHRLPFHAVEGQEQCAPGQVVLLDDEQGILDLRRVPHENGHPRAFIQNDFVDAKPQKASLLRIGKAIASAGLDGAHPYRAAADLLRRRPPRAGQPDGAPIGEPGNETAAAVRAALALRGSYLPIQGPPGSGKTYTGAHIALALVRAGRTVGVTANSHKVIGNLLRAIAELAEKEGARGVRIGQRSDASEGYPEAEHFGGPVEALAALADGTVNVLGGTAWLWARPDAVDAVDVLIVDEAGQMALANTVAVSPAGDSLVLLGDPQQLDQPTQGSHPPGSARSALAHVLDGAPTIPADRGIFLERTWRLHDEICRFTSELFYADELAPIDGLSRQRVDGPSSITGSGLRVVQVAHTGRTNSSPEEADAVATLVRSLADGAHSWTDREGRVRPVTLADILVIAPYNAHLTLLGARLPAKARYGTVDKFQGQEAAVAIYTMASSSVEEAPRGFPFLYSLNRLNVATSRARCLAIVVASPALLDATARTPAQMRLANGLARFVEGAIPLALD